jgi:hypothetical protein
VKVRSAEARSINAAADGAKRLRDFEDSLVQKLEELWRLYADNIQTIGGLCSLMPMEEPSAEYYLRWLSEEVSGLPVMFIGVNENFASAAIEGALAMDGDSVDLDVVPNATAEGSMDVFLVGPNVRRAAQAVLKKWRRSFGYDYVLSIIRTKQEDVLAYFQLLF